MGETGSLISALEAWKSILGPDQVQEDPNSRKKFETATFDISRTVLAALYPSSADEVVHCVEIANRYKIPLYAISSGRNWGFGSAAPVCDGHVVLNLARMNRILEFNEKLGYAVLEPGVTFKELKEFLDQKRGTRFWIDSTGASSLSSVIGNTLERGHGQTPYCDHVANIGFMEVVTGSGKILSTGYGGFGNSKNSCVDKWGLGPSLDGLFSQSNFGIVTKMAVWLMPAPDFNEAIQFGIDKIENFAKVYDGLEFLRLKGILKSGPHFGNLYFSLARIMRFPWDLTAGKTPLSFEQARALGKKKEIYNWNGMINLCGTRSEVDGARAEVQKVLQGSIDKLFILNDATMDIVKDIPRDWVRDLNAFYNQVTGGLGGTGLPRCYWRKKTAPPKDLSQIDLDTDRCGVICVPASCPADSSDIVKVSDILHGKILEYGFEPFVALFGTRARSAQFHAFILFDRDVAGDDEKAREAELALNKEFFALGYHPHRLSVSQMNLMSQLNPVNRTILRELKKIFDPNGIISQGRYFP